MPRSPERPEVLRNRIFRGKDAVGRGFITRDQLRSAAWSPLFRGIYVDSASKITHKVRCLAASMFVLPPSGAIAGRSAAHLLGVPYVATDDPVEVSVPVRFGPVAGLAVHREPLPPSETHKVGEIMMTRPLRTCWDLARWLDPIEAIVFIDALLAQRVVTPAELSRYAEAQVGKRGCRQFERVIELADGAAESPQETRLRVRLVLSGITGLVVQYVITRNGQFVARVDLGLPEYRIAIEYDGYWHGDKAQLERDRRRLNHLLGADWLVLHVTASRLRDDFDGILREVEDAIKKRR